MSPKDEIERVEVEFRKDELLAMYLALLARVPESEIPLTIILPGAFITGIGISQSSYLRLVGEQMARRLAGPGSDPSDTEAAEGLKSLFVESASTLDADEKEAEAHSKPLDLDSRENLYLRDVRVVGSPIVQAGDDVILKIRMRDISGFGYGRIGFRSA